MSRKETLAKKLVSERSPTVKSIIQMSISKPKYKEKSTSEAKTIRKKASSILIKKVLKNMDVDGIEGLLKAEKEGKDTDLDDNVHYISLKRRSVKEALNK